MKYTATLLLFLLCYVTQAQETNYRTKTVAVADSVVVDTLSINPNWFILKTKNKVTLDTSYYNVDFSKALLTFKKPLEADSIEISYLRFPDFLTQKYQQLDESVIVNSTGLNQKLYKLSQPTDSRKFTPFDGLNTTGSISRGVTIGNNSTLR